MSTATISIFGIPPEMNSVALTKMEEGVKGKFNRICNNTGDDPFYFPIAGMGHVLEYRVRVRIDNVEQDKDLKPDTLTTEIGTVVFDSVSQSLVLGAKIPTPVVQVECFNKLGNRVGFWSSKFHGEVVRDLFTKTA